VREIKHHHRLPFISSNNVWYQRFDESRDNFVQIGVLQIDIARNVNREQQQPQRVFFMCIDRYVFAVDGELLAERERILALLRFGHFGRSTTSIRYDIRKFRLQQRRNRANDMKNGYQFTKKKTGNDSAHQQSGRRSADR
jgi:hypothetical protein